MKRFQIVLAAMLLSAVASATEGMWLPYMLMGREGDMQAKGLQLSAEDIYSVNNGSLKDAIVSFGGFCTGEIISDEGLVLTNHHCGYSAIQSHSSVENNYLRDGYWAMDRSQELPNDGLFVRFVKYIEDVTPHMLMGVTNDLTDEEKSAVLRANAESLISDHKSRNDYEYEIKEIFYGNQFIIIASVRYTDVRLVGAPPSSIGKYGADTDNWVWPRHTGDFSMFRIYADVNNNPADYSESNVPFKPFRSLAVSLAGTKPGDFTMVYGFPGRTEEYLPAIAVEQMVDVLNPNKIAIRDIILEETGKYMRADEAIKIQYASKYAGTANAWKKWIGQVEGIQRTHGTDSIRIAEIMIQYQLSKDANHWKQYGHVLPQLEKLYVQALDAFIQRDQFIEIGYRGIEAFRQLWSMHAWVDLAEEGDTAGIEENAAKLLGSLSSFYKDYNASVDSSVATSLITHWLMSSNAGAPLEAKLVSGENGMRADVSTWYTADMVLRPSQSKRVLDALENDPVSLAYEIYNSEIYGAMKSAFDHYITQVAPIANAYQAQIDELQKEFMAAQMLVGDAENLYPDANSTMRITYGQVEGYRPADAVSYKTHTYLDGVIAKYVPGDYEFDLPERVLELYNENNYGQYAAENGQLPVCFIASNHTSGGNSGSPALNGKGELIGLNFDRVWEGTMSDVYFDPSICRNIMVDIRYVLWVVDVYAGAGHLVEEMNIVR
ncbi:S46 family peptidase [Phaeocystidibacter marisrubri]|uniref:Dipeptidyl-peptidase n=1 Tax=Phaeocystidibacter marisrubri TaxID=1577780 RepID=A0A6L3ZKX7_9FLAO|nr:S46 family peptidase [Phaeocystidibacter marisrubri]KAB2817810.1 S46 family peptidase [Phaeocystidibacter marisrubri]GGH73409.1 Asp/Glu-specific dipeptidyl-peptidase [Phaeocystidibacter marisrubri]